MVGNNFQQRNRQPILFIVLISLNIGKRACHIRRVHTNKLNIGANKDNYKYRPNMIRFNEDDACLRISISIKEYNSPY